RFDKEAYRQRACAEQCFGWLKEWRAVATRYDKYASTYRSTVELACIARYLKHLFSNKA
ncbi:MAG: transposase, partial [Myxococcota bacterium]